MTAASADARVQRLWLRHVVASGEAGRLWAEAYQEWQSVELLSSEALDLWRQKAPGAPEALERAQIARDEIPRQVPLSIRALLDRWFFGVAGYAHFAAGDFELAAAAMERARQAVIDAIAEAPFLVSFAHHCHEFTLHQARIERNQRRWDPMWQHVAEAEAMLGGSRPLCVLPEQKEISIATLRDYYASLELSPSDRQQVAIFFDDALRMRLFEGFVRRMVTDRDLTIAFP